MNSEEIIRIYKDAKSSGDSSEGAYVLMRDGFSIDDAADLVKNGEGDKDRIIRLCVWSSDLWEVLL